MKSIWQSPIVLEPSAQKMVRLPLCVHLLEVGSSLRPFIVCILSLLNIFSQSCTIILCSTSNWVEHKISWDEGYQIELLWCKDSNGSVEHGGHGQRQWGQRRQICKWALPTISHFLTWICQDRLWESHIGEPWRKLCLTILEFRGNQSKKKWNFVEIV